MRRRAKHIASAEDYVAGGLDASMRRKLGGQALLYFVILLVVFAVLGFGVYQVICGSVYRVVDESLLASRPATAAIAEPMDATSVDEATPAGEEAGFGAPAMTTMADSLANASFASIILLRDATGALVEVEGLYAAYPDSFRDVPFDAEGLERIGECVLDGHAYRMVSYRVDALDAAGTPIEDAGAGGGIAYMQVLIGVDSEKAIVEHAGVALTVYLLFAVVVSAAAGVYFSSRVTSSLMASWKSQAEFVQNASHELKTPLAVIQASGEALMGRPESTIIDCFEIVGAMTEESRRMSRLVDDLMQLAASDAGHMDLDVQPVCVDDMVDAFAGPYVDLADAQGKTLEIDSHVGGTVALDADKLRQLLGILLDNALKYTDDGDLLGVEAKREGSRLVLRVWDTGRGMAPEERDRAFKRFYRSDKARAGAAAGMGLGLSLAQAIVDAHGGAIVLEPREPKGTCAVVTLPA